MTIRKPCKSSGTDLVSDVNIQKLYDFTVSMFGAKIS